MHIVHFTMHLHIAHHIQQKTRVTVSNRLLAVAISSKVIKFLASDAFSFRAQIASKSVFGWGSALDPAEGTYDAPQTLYSAAEGDNSSQTHSPRCIRHLAPQNPILDPPDPQLFLNNSNTALNPKL